MKTLLDDFGFEHDIVNNGKIAIEKMVTTSYDIVLMDLQMPEMNGFETTKYLRNQMKSPVPIIALTADVTTADLEKCKAVGMNSYISKPIDERVLYRKMVELLKKPLTRDEREKEIAPEINSHKEADPKKCTDLQYLYKRTKNDPLLIKEMIKLYLDQTPLLIDKMKQSQAEKDWDSLFSAVHKIIPSLSIMGMNKKYETIAKTIQEYSSSKQNLDKINDLIIQLDAVCSQSYLELNEEFEKNERK